MRNLLGRLHARRLPELLRIAEAWGVPLYVENKSEVVGALYRAMTDPRTMRDLWDRLDPAERAVVIALADAPESALAPTVDELATRLGVAAAEARETALHLYRAGILFREGDDEPLPIGVMPRLLLPRELALQVRRIQDEMAAGNLAQSPLRVLIELLDDAELEAAAKIWGLRTVPGVARRRDLAAKLLRLINDPTRVERVVRGRGRDAVAVWKIVSAAPEPTPLVEVAAGVGLDGSDTVTVARLRAALAELEGALLVWHAYRGDGTRWLFVPAEVRSPGEARASVLPDLVTIELESGLAPPWRHPDAVSWDLLTLLRIVANPQTPVWEATETPPRWLLRAVASRLWFGGKDGPPIGYLELLQALALGEGILAIDEDARPRRIVTGPHARAWRGIAFGAQTIRLRDRWLRLPRWIEGDPAGAVDVWGADWRGMRPRLLSALADPEMGVIPPRWVTLESLALRLAARYPRLLGPSFTAATARLGGEAGAGVDEDEAHAAALSDVIALELGGPFVWFALTEVVDRAGQARAIRLTQIGAAAALRKPEPAEDDAGDAPAPLVVDPSGEITLQSPSPDRVWALTAFSELVDLGRPSHYRLTSGSLGAALATGVELDQIVKFLERGSRQSLPHELAANLATWARGYRRIRMRRAVILRPDDSAERAVLLQALREAGWSAEPLGDLAVVVSLATDATDAGQGEEALIGALRAAGHAPRWATVYEGTTALSGASIAPVDQNAASEGD
jgi:Helicase conserved C-terminal domain